ncbi:disulfide bond formation protein DsbB [Glaesserella parasuis]|uniref:disulfide bond formation protein DsbB n=1 Tax=Glaesserella parasuis TaxID=738 RepID=UPI00136538FA|nr:disulfide bond formation protein DsbB [Glaesserella parasuis]MCT8555254.1 disulfide bond formation protein DsbB [Glaesserella parasuis]MCT8704495.1 disulfide bond formation protein DsbB [Glaesserella parasuis]MCT8706206.1 disulfide bond formation protein DsbB [Glaesserella parasuis]MCT8708111.1 disulfide bond formation protein DsbB [Glaesserella parasuis]MCT8709872.1 disulfide bond formation protein DsbB [Glaesserella parasuis]
MLTYFKELSISRSAWLLLTASCTALEAAALYFQHGMGLNPCVMCIYERLALLAILIAGIIGFLAPRKTLVRWLALLLGLFGSIKGLSLAIKHTDYQLNPAPWNQCSPFVDFPETLPLNKWFPDLFEATGKGDCGKVVWQFLDLSMPQWLIVVFSIYIVVFAVIIISQFKHTSSYRTLFR